MLQYLDTSYHYWQGEKERKGERDAAPTTSVLDWQIHSENPNLIFLHAAIHCDKYFQELVEIPDLSFQLQT